ncbi:hypothetical protein MSG28_014301 [Choristoneura fumiferana]|uniref:Uncharacterized protein n=2 Tax=Choristoneura fumiferana TaxID=7141 RepID=A0ACC0JGJ4_CHOFU|nr:hypothetical protein MSG28_014301 [Choristoneura fumiferana]KAI8423276.1 hypothetical protein MSG28_014301 [Choristoneura fumiferana]
MNELKSLEHATLKRVMDVEARAVGAVAGELDGAARAPTPTPTPTPAAGEITELLGGMSINEELQAALVCKKRLEHLKEQAVTLTEPSTPQVREFIELVRADRRLEAVKYAKKHLSQYEDGHGARAPAAPRAAARAARRAPAGAACAQHAISLTCARHTRNLHTQQPAISLTRALHLRHTRTQHTSRCYNAATQVAACPACAAPLNQLARTLPHAHVSHSRLVCRLSRAPLNEHNQPMALPNGQVYGEQALKEMMNEHGSIVCPKTNEVFCMKRVEKVYVM